jgi:pimeloyl-ACP methyl ester carboxylesterase
MHASTARNSTIGRAFIRLASTVAPGVVERQALERFVRPPRALAPVAPEVPGLKARRLDLAAGKERIALWEWGAGPTVLLVHGWGGQAAQMARFVAPLVEAGHRAVAFDLPGHGASTGARATVVDLAAAVATVAERVAPVHAVIAHSLGATASALALGRGGALGGTRAVLVAPPAELPFFVRSFADAAGLPPARGSGMVELVRRELGDLDALDLRRRAPAMAAPLLVIHDANDREVPFDHGAALAAAWPGARLVRTAGLGHRRLLADPTVVAESVRFATA